MILTATDILQRQIVRPLVNRTVRNGLSFGLGPAGYDIRVREGTNIMPGDFWLASTVEEFDMPLDVVGIVHDKSSWARRGVVVQNTVLEPGWRGFLTLELTNHGPQGWQIEPGDPIAQVIFHFTNGPCVPYKGKYQDQIPRPVGTLLEN